MSSVSPATGILQPGCADPHPGHVACLAEFKPLTGASGTGGPSRSAAPQTSNLSRPPASTATGPFYAADLQSLYALPTFTGTPTIAIIDVGHDPSALADLTYYRSQTGIAALTPGQFSELNQQGETGPLPAESPGWDMEIAMDLDVVSAVCSTCHVMLVDAESSAVPDILTATSSAVARGAQYVALSLGTPEFAEQTSLDRYLSAPDVTYVAASGDNGFGSTSSPQLVWPASSANVVAAGGVSATRSTTLMGQTTWSLSAWSGAGSGCSAYEPSLPAQSNGQPDEVAACHGSRGVADLSALADPDTGVAVYYHQQWVSGGGTSAAAPALAAMYAMAGNHTDERAPYASASAGGGASSGIRDVTSGASTGCPGAMRSCSSQAGWDGPTGLGVPQGLEALVTTTAPHGPTTIGLSRPGDLHVRPMEVIDVPIGFATNAPYDATIALNLPSGLTATSTGPGTQAVSGFLTKPGVYVVTATPHLARPDAAYLPGPGSSFTITVGAPANGRPGKRPGKRPGRNRFVGSGRATIHGTVRGSVRKGRRVRAELPALRGLTARGKPTRPSIVVVWLLDGSPVARGRSVVIAGAWSGQRLSFIATVTAVGFQDYTVSSAAVRVTD